MHMPMLHLPGWQSGGSHNKKKRPTKRMAWHGAADALLRLLPETKSSHSTQAWASPVSLRPSKPENPTTSLLKKPLARVANGFQASPAATETQFFARVMNQRLL